MIFYFSGTGNTRWAAQKVAEATGDRLLFIPDELKGDCSYSLVPHEAVGFCFPVHGWQPPHIVREFIRRLKLTSSFPLKIRLTLRKTNDLSDKSSRANAPGALLCL